MDWKGRSKKEILAVSVACMAIYLRTPSFKGRKFKLCVLTSSPLRGSCKGIAANVYQCVQYFLCRNAGMAASAWEL